MQKRPHPENQWLMPGGFSASEKWIKSSLDTNKIRLKNSPSNRARSETARKRSEKLGSCAGRACLVDHQPDLRWVLLDVANPQAVIKVGNVSVAPGRSDHVSRCLDKAQIFLSEGRNAKQRRESR
jgi:hypothetical protein